MGPTLPSSIHICVCVCVGGGGQQAGRVGLQLTMTHYGHAIFFSAVIKK